MPQDLSPEDVAAYFACLPVQAVPLIGSEGEIWRHQQLYTQMPPWDTEPGACDHLTAEELASFRRMDEVRRCGRARDGIAGWAEGGQAKRRLLPPLPSSPLALASLRRADAPAQGL